MKILGLNAYHGDASACLIRDGELVVACEEERLNRIKHCAGFPKLAIESCLKEGGVTLQELDGITVSRNPSVNLHKKILYTLQRSPSFSGLLKGRVANLAKILSLEKIFEKEFKLSGPLKPRVYRVEHHLAHMGSAFFVSPFEETAVVSIDGFGDFASAKWGYGEGRQIRVLGQVCFPHSLGILYTAITQFLGFPKFGDEYKVMALASFGTPRFVKEFQELISLQDGRGFELNLDYFRHHREGVELSWEKGPPIQGLCYSERLKDLFGNPRRLDEPLTERHYDIASSLQLCFEEICFGLLRKVYELTKKKNLCLAGGCAHNSVAVGKIQEKTPFREVFIQPAAGDAGTSIGGSFYAQHMIFKQDRRYCMKDAYLGPRFDASEIQSVLEKAKLPFKKLPLDELTRIAAQAIAAGKIIGWFQGRMEFGPRALGARSLLADPRRKEMKDILNRRIKHRESFRPFAPSVLEEALHDYFEDAHPDPFMTRVFRIRTDKQELVPAITHVDRTGRVQTVAREANPRYWSLINEFRKLTGVPILLNTSFNDNEPIVCTPKDAVECFVRTGMDALAAGDYWVEQSR